MSRECVPCPSCKRMTFSGGACWDHKCVFRACEQCGRPTGSQLVALCLVCDFKDPLPQLPGDPELERAIAFMKDESRTKGRRKPR